MFNNFKISILFQCQQRKRTKQRSRPVFIFFFRLLFNLKRDKIGNTANI